MTKIAVLIVAAGRGSRAGAGLPKQYRQLGKKTVLRHCVESFQKHPAIKHIQVVIHPDDKALYQRSIDDLTLLPPINGGAERQQSVHEGLKALQESQPDAVLIHDAARPFVPIELIDRLISALEQEVAVIPGIPVVDTVKRTDNNQVVVETVDRTQLYRVQTPQAFRYAEIVSAHRLFEGQQFTDDAALIEANGQTVKIVVGDERCLKLTTPDDFIRAKEMTETKQLPRIGSGFDVHRFGPGGHVTLCGIEIPHDYGLVGHSDADVGLHALTDALLGAVAAGDIGQHFPPSDPQWRGAASDKFLKHACELVSKRGGEIINVDVTLICQAPKIGPHRDAMASRIAEILELPVTRVSVKATTTEELGFTGRGEGIAAQAVAMVLAP
ncbi:bifunctional 2-C-methyl-D-erythritol 4-phosphate cytidylyltransferase/2-C-methyl-D-erythritol 2,4-cyclodiphosphate synthase [Aestuariispira ectoiniformans]|uniref:bifunctional 2-C-methyl-D-erythritol 4-phosphate cytidylyltransferase/2-C-methyl-D-erythritol 2,4-cyclodiphosphate synthase n=1 Tax=Aestuariispira ectoiniformans TaxID=2775080 RepID=UPI00223A9B56|nr:bifunctional 2-C-methyl-D-erythritol 4-phosphate cytidylyltransferase/2-C-methyl-D-erythritol 2,4-cyclodiphosphate synthase [Aestuariispira ectoiniformans]